MNTEALVKNTVWKIYSEYPDVEWEDLEGQAWLIITEEIENYDESKGASLATFLSRQIDFGLRKYCERVLLRGFNMNGLRDHGDYHEDKTVSIESQMEARDQLEKVMAGRTEQEQVILRAISLGYTQAEAAEQAGVRQQRVSELLKEVRDSI